MNHDVLHCIMSKHALTNVNHEKQLVDGYCHSMIFSSKNNNMHFMKKIWKYIYVFRCFTNDTTLDNWLN